MGASDTPHDGGVSWGPTAPPHPPFTPTPATHPPHDLPHHHPPYDSPHHLPQRKSGALMPGISWAPPHSLPIR